MSASTEHVSIWPDLLKQISAEVLSDSDLMEHSWPQFISTAQKENEWLGFAGTSESDLKELEQRLGVTLPPSYRAFLLASNGFGPINSFISRLYPSTELDWLVNKDKEIVEIWEDATEGFPVSDEDYFDPESMQDARYTRGEYFRGCLMISDWGDAGFLALNPAVKYDGEWEAWHFANWHPGAVRYHSFAELMQQSLESYREIKRDC
jgi:hypothetical protein